MSHDTCQEYRNDINAYITILYREAVMAHQFIHHENTTAE